MKFSRQNTKMECFWSHYSKLLNDAQPFYLNAASFAEIFASHIGIGCLKPALSQTSSANPKLVGFIFFYFFTTLK
jgi:hypothetical protein